MFRIGLGRIGLARIGLGRIDWRATAGYGPPEGAGRLRFAVAA
jgi:hypothetical protein